jgi:hypothetical protein
LPSAALSTILCTSLQDALSSTTVDLTHQRLLSRFDGLPAGRPPDRVDALLDQILRTVLTFSPDEADLVTTDPSRSTSYEATDLVSHLKATATWNYWKAIDVPRDNLFADIASKVGAGRYVPLLGSKGTGKSTLAIRYYRSLLANFGQPTTSFDERTSTAVYVDVNQFAYWRTWVTQPGDRATACDATARLLHGILFEEGSALEPNESGRQASYDAPVPQAGSFSPPFEAVSAWYDHIAGQQFVPADLRVEWKQLINLHDRATETFRSSAIRVQELLKEEFFSSLTGHHKISMIAHFLAKRNHRLYVIIDNLDSMIETIADDVFAEAKSLTNTHPNLHYLVCARPPTYRYFMEYRRRSPPLQGGYGLESKPAEFSTEDPDDDSALTVTLDFDFFSECLQARLDFAAEQVRNATSLDVFWQALWHEDTSLVAIRDYLEIEGAKDGWLTRLERDYGAHFQTILGKLSIDLSLAQDSSDTAIPKADHQRLRVLRWLFRWHNSSLRSTFLAAVDLVDFFYFRGDPVRLGAKSPQGNDRYVRSALRDAMIRIFTFGDTAMPKTPPLSKAVIPHTLDAFLAEAELEHSAAPNFSFIYALSCLWPPKTSGRVRAEEPWKKFEIIEDLFGQFGLTSDEAAVCVRVLCSPRFTGAEPLVEADCLPAKMPDEFSGDFRIRMTQAGWLFLDKVSVSVEYLCWSALQLPIDEPMTAELVALVPEHTDYQKWLGRRENRLLLASAFLTEVLVPLAVEDLEQADRWGTHAKFNDRSVDALRERLGWTTKSVRRNYVVRALASHRDYATKIADKDTGRRVEGSLKRVEEQVRASFL